MLNTDKFGYASNGDWHPIAAEHNDALAAIKYCDDYDRLEMAEEDLKKLRRQIEDRLRKDRWFLYEVAMLIK